MYDLHRIPEDYPWACHRRVFGERVYDPSLFEWCPAGWGDALRDALDRIERVLSESEHMDSFTVSYLELSECRFFASFDAEDIDELSREKIFHCLAELSEDLLDTCWFCGKKGPVGAFGNGSYIACLECADAIMTQN